MACSSPGSPRTPMSAEAYAVETRELTRRFGKRVAVDHLDLRVRAGELYGFLGPNGAGKSTTLRMLCGLLDPSEGGGTVLGIDLVAEPERIKSVIGYMSQKFSLYDDLSVDENLSFYARVYEVPRARRTGRIAQMVRMADLTERERQLAGTLSGGYRQRLALACALVHAPRLIFLDEPTAGVDPVSRRNFWGLVRRLADEGTTIIVTTHYMDEAELCDTLGFIYQGQLIAQGSPQTIKTETFRQPVVETEVGEIRRPTWRAISSARGTTCIGSKASNRRWRTSSSRSWTSSARLGCASSSAPSSRTLTPTLSLEGRGSLELPEGRGDREPLRLEWRGNQESSPPLGERTKVRGSKPWPPGCSA